MFRVNISKKDAFKLKWRLSGISNTTGETMISRVAKAGRKLAFYSN